MSLILFSWSVCDCGHFSRDIEITVCLDSGKIYNFNKCDEGLYYFDIVKQEGFDVVMELVS